jgi:hypothetical protein
VCQTESAASVMKASFVFIFLLLSVIFNWTNVCSLHAKLK